MIDDIIHDRKIQLPENHELVLELEHNKDGTGNYWCYYFVNHERRCLFWLDEFDISNDLSEIKGVTSAAHVKHEIEAKYWAHWEMFPYGHEIPKTVFTELMGIILHGNIDRMTSTTSTVTYDSDELHRMLSLVKSAKELGATDHTAATIGRLMCLFAHHRFLNFHGQHGARLCRDQTIYGQPNFNRSLLMNLLSPLFFNAPSEHLRGLEQIWIDNVMVYSQWKHFIEKLKGEWTDFLLPATVLLNANVAFLAIPSVDPGNGAPEIPRNAAQITSYLSMIFSIGSMILSLLLTRQHRLKNRDSADEVVKYLTNKTHPTLGLETLAIMYSLPYAMLMWATVSFLVAFSFECFLKGDNVSTITTAIAWFAVMSLVGWCVFTAWEEHEETTLRIMWTRFMDAATHVRSRAGGEVAALSKWKAYFDRSPLSTVRGDSPSNRGATSPHLLPA
ncbi:hypothetical protein CERSUDRAFT_157231 [Gelatoporia subvermispora B]|uniref:Uncharacterized protein n=1 Tax=Ceriporiopsis subvermispora (strain B) TaxID=914234 RepID=M2RAL4_CERS8|nr:hypothetical protein CERSUDRAFT_157231 [Gelatoporia subvermispora B]